MGMETSRFNRGTWVFSNVCQLTDVDSRYGLPPHESVMVLPPSLPHGDLLVLQRPLGLSPLRLVSMLIRTSSALARLLATPSLPSGETMPQLR
jgi:hypothetical protein